MGRGIRSDVAVCESRPTLFDRHYSPTSWAASFVGFAPYQSPRIVLYVMIDEPYGSHHGSGVAGPVWQDVMIDALRWMGVPPTEPLVAANVSVIVLGCTHYPLLKHTIAEVAAELSGRIIPVVDSAEATAAAVQAWIADEKIAAAGSDAPFAEALQLLVTDLPKSFASMAEQMLGGSAPHVTQVDLTA